VTFPLRAGPRCAGNVARAGLAAALLLAGCDRETRTGDADLQVRWSFEPSPPQVGTAEVRLEVSDVDWTPRNGATVILSGTRNGVVLSVDTARGEGAGQYVAPAFRFEVSGDWVLRARVETPDRRWVEVERTVTVGTTGS